jgi:hypothetical protein
MYYHPDDNLAKLKSLDLRTTNGGLIVVTYKDFETTEPLIVPTALYENLRHVGKLYKKKYGDTYKNLMKRKISDGFIKTNVTNLAYDGCFDEAILIAPIEVWRES